MEDWVIERLQEFVGRSDREELGPRVPQALTFQSSNGHSSYRAARNLPSLGRGLVVTEDGVVPAYARVRRVFHLTNAIKKYYYSPFFLEKQVPGYLARVAWLDGRQVGFTRDGRYCAFTSDRAADFIPDAFFEANPNLVVCLSIEGTGIPYAKPSYRGALEDIAAWGTEIFELGVREPLTAAAKYELFEEFNIQGAEKVGPYDVDDVDTIRAWLQELQAAGERGVVLKPTERHHRPMKYSLPGALLSGAPSWLGLDSEIEEDPFLDRLLQAACSASEVGVGHEDWDWEAVGKAMFANLSDTVERVSEGGALTEEFSVWVHAKEAATMLLEELEERTPGMSITELELVEENDGWRLRFERRFAEATAGIERRLAGLSYRD